MKPTPKQFRQSLIKMTSNWGLMMLVRGIRKVNGDNVEEIPFTTTL
jgi:hypothetical protein